MDMKVRYSPMMRGQKEAPRNGVPFLDSHRPAAYPIGGNDAEAGLQDQCFLERWKVRLIVWNIA